MYVWVEHMPAKIIYMCIYIWIHTNVGHDNNVDDLLIVHFHRYEFLSKRKKKPHNGYSDVSVCSFSFFFLYSTLFLLSSVYVHTRQKWSKKEERKRIHVYVRVHKRTDKLCSDGGSSRLERMKK